MYTNLFIENISHLPLTDTIVYRIVHTYTVYVCTHYDQCIFDK